MKQDLKVSGLSFNVGWKAKDLNLEQLSQRLPEATGDIILLPEMFPTGFCIEENIAEKNGSTLQWMKVEAQKLDKMLGGSVAVYENGHAYNRFYFVLPDGNNYQYDKRHLFSYAGEEKVFSPGTEKIIVEVKGWKILLQVCYDLRFPVFARNTERYDAIFYVANWPEKRIDAWNTLLKARAIENQCYVFGLNRTGVDGNGFNYPESTHCFFADGSEVSVKENDWISATFHDEKLAKFRERFPFLADADDFQLKL